MPQFNWQFLRCEVIKFYAGRDRQYDVGDIVLWPGEIALPDWLKSLGNAEDTPKKTPDEPDRT